MISEHAYIFEQMRRDAIDEALAYYNMGDNGLRETVFVHGFVRLTLGSTVKVILSKGRNASEEYEWPRSAISYEWESMQTALIEIPKSFVKVFGLAAFVLDAETLERHQRYVEHFNSPKLPPPPTRQLESVGSVRI